MIPKMVIPSFDRAWRAPGPSEWLRSIGEDSDILRARHSVLPVVHFRIHPCNHYRRENFHGWLGWRDDCCAVVSFTPDMLTKQETIVKSSEPCGKSMKHVRLMNI